MGINVCLYRKVGMVTDETEPPYADMHRVPSWDVCRQAGDRDFDNSIEWEYFDMGLGRDEYKRPKDISDAMLWVNDNLEGKRRGDYLKALNEMITDPDLYFYISR